MLATRLFTRLENRLFFSQCFCQTWRLKPSPLEAKIRLFIFEQVRIISNNFEIWIRISNSNVFAIFDHIRIRIRCRISNIFELFPVEFELCPSLHCTKQINPVIRNKNARSRSVRYIWPILTVSTFINTVHGVLKYFTLLLKRARKLILILLPLK